MTSKRLNRQRKQPNAELRESIKNKPATLQKLYNHPKKASARPHRKQHQERSRLVVLLLPGVVLLLRAQCRWLL